MGFSPQGKLNPLRGGISPAAPNQVETGAGRANGMQGVSE